MLLVKITAKFLRGLVTIGTYCKQISRKLFRPLRAVGRVFLFIAVVPIYKTYLSIKKVLTKFYAPQLSRHVLIHPLSRRYLVHITAILIGIFTIVSSLSASDIRRDDTANRQSLLSILAQPPEDLGIVSEQVVIPTDRSKISAHYADQNTISYQPQLASVGDDDDNGYEPMITGGTAVIRPLISPSGQLAGGRSGILNYTIHQGDTISGIAEQFGISVNTILWENNLTAYSLIRPGDSLAILPQTGIRHKVGRGDSITSIAKKYGIESDAIIHANALASANDIVVGEYLMIPGGKKIIGTPAPSTYLARQPVKPSGPVTPIQSTGVLMWPNACRRITQYFGWVHTGVDIACPIGSPVRAADSGRVVKAQGGWNGGYGNYVIIDHGGGMQTLYGHASKLYVRPGDVVSKGDVIMAEGSTGHSTGPHLHFEVRINGVRKNPLSYVK